MYFFIYDSLGDKRKYRKETEKIQMKLAEFGIADEHARATPLRTVSELVKDALHREVSNIVVVGDDHSAHAAINVMAKSKTQSSLGFIPISKDSLVAKVLGIPFGQRACKTIAQRKIKKVDLGRIGNEFFLTYLTMNAGPENGEPSRFARSQSLPKSCAIDIPWPKDATMTISMREALIVNVSPWHKEGRLQLGERRRLNISPTDGMLDFFFLPSTAIEPDVYRNFRQGSFMENQELSYFRRSELTITAKNDIALIADNTKTKQFPINITTVPKALQIIVGSDRLF
ncbi:MAG: hypothetical protein ACD_68C00109G0001 [uncultured bacterium]|nr:MAG: hypothetical protein ACD_68C00109G0001 [uncultured bacterium]